MTIEELRLKLLAIEDHSRGDNERDHIYADDLLLEFIGDPEITKFYRQSGFWYA